MKATLRQILVTAAGVLLAAAYVTIAKALDMDWATLGVGAVALFGIVYVLGVPPKEEG